MRVIGEMYVEGIGVARDPMLADAWFAARELEAKLTPEQVRQAQIEASQIIDSIGPREERIRR